MVLEGPGQPIPGIWATIAGEDQHRRSSCRGSAFHSNSEWQWEPKAIRPKPPEICHTSGSGGKAQEEIFGFLLTQDVGDWVITRKTQKKETTFILWAGHTVHNTQARTPWCYIYFLMVFSLYPEPQQKGRKKKMCSQWQSWKWVANLSLACLSPGNTLANVCSPRALEAANTLTGSVNNEQTLYRISCHMMAPDMRLAMTWGKQLAKRPAVLDPASTEPLVCTSLPSLAQIGAERESG